MAKLIDITGKALAGEWGTDDETGDGIPVLRTTNFTNEGVVNYKDVVTRTITKKNIEDKFLRKGDIIIEKSGESDKFPVGRVIYFEGEEKTYLFNNFTGLLRVKNQDFWYPKYVFYSLFDNYKRGGTRAFENKTTGLHNLKTDDYVTRYEVVETDKVEQILICDKLDKLYGVIKLREHELQLLDDLIKARFVEMSSKWNVYKLPLSNFLDGITYGFTNPMPDSNVGPWKITAKDVVQGHVNYDTARKTTQEAYDMLTSKSKPNVGDVLLTKDGTLGRTAIVENNNICVNQSVAVLRCNNNVLPRFLALLLQLPEYQAEMTKNSGGGTIKHIYITKVDKMLVKIPDICSQKEYVRFVEQVDKSKVAVQKALNEAQQLFDSLMQEYFG